MKKNFTEMITNLMDEAPFETPAVDPLQGHDIVVIGLPGNPSHIELDSFKGLYTGKLRAAIPLTPSLAKDPTPEISVIEVWTQEEKDGGFRLGTQIFKLEAYGSYETRMLANAGKGAVYMLYEIQVRILDTDPESA